MRRLSNRSLVLPVLMAFLLLCVPAYGKTYNTKTKTKQAKTRVSKKAAVRTPAKPVKTGNQEVDQAQNLLSSGITRLSVSSDCQC
jgi:hypothetical protein